MSAVSMSDQRMEGEGNQVSNDPKDHVNEHDGIESLRTQRHQRTWAELADMHLAYGAAHGNSREARRLYGERHPERYLPYHSSFADLARRLRETGSFARRGGGRPRSVRTPTFEEDVLRRVAGNQGASTRGIAHAMEVSPVLVCQVMDDEGLDDEVQLQKVQGLKPHDYPLRVHFAQWYLHKIVGEPDFASLVMWSDEACFSRDGFFNSRNSHIWDFENPLATIIHHNQDQFAVNVWAGMVGDNILGPFFLPPMLNAGNYLEFLQNDLPQLLKDVPLNLRQRMWLLQDGAPLHFGIDVRRYISKVYPNRWIGRAGPVAWPPCSPDLTPLDFFVWGHVKTLVYASPVENQEDLTHRIDAAFNKIRAMPGVCERVRQSIYRRCNACIEAGGQHFEHLL